MGVGTASHLKPEDIGYFDSNYFDETNGSIVNVERHVYYCEGRSQGAWSRGP